MSTIALVEDNLDFRVEVAFYLRRAGFTIAFESDGRDIDAMLERYPCDLMLLDLGLPREDGMALTRRLRIKQPQLRIVMLTARTEITDRLAGLDQGADAYLTKPVDMRELIAVINSVLRRVSSPLPEGAWCLSIGGLSLDAPGGESVLLSASEAQLLLVLAKAWPNVASREQLAAALGHQHLDFDYRRLEVSFSRLRAKIDAVLPGNRLIRAARGRGYLFAAPIQVAHA